MLASVNDRVHNLILLKARSYSPRPTKMRKDWPVSAVKLVDGLAGESPVSASFPVGAVVISGDGAGDQAIGSPEVNVLVGRMRNLVSSEQEGKQSSRS